MPDLLSSGCFASGDIVDFETLKMVAFALGWIFLGIGIAAVWVWLWLIANWPHH